MNTLEPSWPAVLARWSVEPAVVVFAALAVVAYLRGAGRLAARGEGPTRRQTGLFAGGVAATCLALLSPVATYSEVLLSAHMVQHLSLVLVAAPLLVGAKCTAVLLAGLPGPAAALLRSIGGSRPARAVTRPVLSWVLFAATGWVVHFSPLFDLALRDPLVHAFEHGLFLGTALLFWGPVVGRDPLSHPAQLLYVVLAMPQNTFLALAVYSASHPLYDTYARLAAARVWGPSALDDQRLGGGLMWVAGDLALLTAVLAVAASWAAASRDETEDGRGAPISGE